MNELDIKKMADEAGVDIEGHILGLPIERQKQIAKRDGYGDNFERFVKETLKRAKESQEFSDSVEFVNFDTVEAAEAAGYTVPRWHNETINARLLDE